MKRLPAKSTVQNKCDALLTPIIKKMYPNCLLCGSETQVAHHHTHKSKSTRLRYDLANLINLCGSCHVKLHHDESFWGSKVTQLRSQETPGWFDYIERAKHETVKADVHWYLENLAKLTAVYESL